MKLGKAIRYARMNLHLDQSELAERVSISRSYLSQIENGKKIPSIEVLETIATAMGMDLGSLIKSAETIAWWE